MKKTINKNSTAIYFKKQAVSGTIEEYLYTKNGLRVLFAHIPNCNTVVTNIVYLVGSRHEVPGKTGIAHMFEHMLFKDTKDKDGKRSLVPRHIPLQNKGALLNASTWTDRTNYYFVMPPEYLDEMLSAEAERMRGLILTPKEFRPEQQNVLSEYEMYASRPDFILDSALTSHAFISHGYGHDTIGFKSDIERLTCDDLQAFYDTYYWPNNAYLVVAGDISREEVFRLVDANFAHIPSSPKAIPQTTIIEPPRAGRQTIEIQRQNPVTLTTLCYPAPRARDREWVIADLALTYLTAGKLSPLYKKLVDTHKASAVHASLMLSYDPSLMSIEVTVSRGTTPTEVQSIVLKEINHLSTHTIKEKDLMRIKNKMIADTLYARDGAQALAHELTEFIASGDWKKYTQIIEEVARVTPEDIQKCARTWLNADTVLIGTLTGTP